jgi:SAM-dependent methyltransferase
MDDVISLPISIPEKADYCDGWSSNAAHFESQGCYDWMADQLSPFKPKRILDIGCGTGEGVIALSRAFSPQIVSIEENSDCIQRSEQILVARGIQVESLFRLGYQSLADGTHEIAFDQNPISVSAQVTLLHADMLVDDPAMLRFFAEQRETFDAVTVWLIGTFMWRRTCQNIQNLKITGGNEYRLRVQSRVYRVASEVLRPGGVLQVVDRGEPPSEQFLVDDLYNAHRDQAKGTDLDVFSVTFREYREPTDRGISMVATVGTSGRKPNLTKLAMVSVLSRKPV